jgi:hypothetical protein
MLLVIWLGRPSLAGARDGPLPMTFGAMLLEPLDQTTSRQVSDLLATCRQKSSLPAAHGLRALGLPLTDISPQSHSSDSSDALPFTDDTGRRCIHIGASDVELSILMVERGRKKKTWAPFPPPDA